MAPSRFPIRLTDKERGLIEGVVFMYLEWCTWWIDEDLKPSEAQNSEKISINLIKDLKDRHKALIISHLCREPKLADLFPDCGGSVYEASLLVIIYHLIWHLLHLDASDNEAELDFNGLQDLDMKIVDLELALKFLENLVKETPRLDCCIISLLHEPEDGRSAS